MIGLINIALDTTAAVIGRRNQQALQQELLHRAKNNLAVTTAVVSSTLRSATNLDAARATIAARIAALGKAQEMLRDTTSDASVSEIVTAALQAPSTGRSGYRSAAFAPGELRRGVGTACAI